MRKIFYVSQLTVMIWISWFIFPSFEEDGNSVFVERGISPGFNLEKESLGLHVLYSYEWIIGYLKVKDNNLEINLEFENKLI